MGRADTPFYMGIYFCFGFGTLLVMIVRSAAVVMGTIRASRKLHSDLLEKVMSIVYHVSLYVKENCLASE